MAIKGYLSEITFVELLKVVGNYNGTLRIWNLTDNKQYECSFFNKSVVYLNFCGKNVTSSETVKEVFFELLTDSKSYYAFEEGCALPEAAPPIVSVEELLDFSVFESAEASDDLLPHISTRFETVNKFDFVLQGELSGFWGDSINFLHKGCSGYDLCIELGLEELLVRRNLYKLRTTGLIKPVRMFAANPLAKTRSRPPLTGHAAGGQGLPHQFQAASNQLPLISQNVVPPDFLLKAVSTLAAPKIAAAENAAPPAPNIAASGPAGRAEFRTAAVVQVSEPPLYHDAAEPADALPVAVHAADFSNGVVDQSIETPPAAETIPALPKRSGLLKRMLASIFKG